MKSWGRRAFVKRSGEACLGLGCLGWVVSLESCVANYLVESTEQTDKVIINKSVLVDTDSGDKRKFVTVKSQRFKESIYLGGVENEQYTAVLTHCTHKGCEVRPAGDILICPCHGSEFSATGQVLKSPAEANLLRFKVSEDDQKVYIHLTR